MEPSADKETGLGASLKGLVGAAMAVVQNRLELLLLEVREERLRAFEAVVWLAAVVVLGCMTLVMVTITAVVLFWEDHRVAVVVTLSVFYLLATVGAFLRLKRRLRHWPAFSATLGELKKDQACLDANR